MRLTKAKATGSGALIIAAAGVLCTTLSGGAASAADSGPGGLLPPLGGTNTHAQEQSLNNSGVSGTSSVHVDGRKLDIQVDAHRLLQGMPHAMHLHFGPNTRHTCPTVRDDANGDHRLNTAEGTPAYGDVRVSLTKRGPHGPGDALAVKRFPTAPNGQIHYDRSIHTTSKMARAVRNGNVAVVIHGIDYNHNGKYDFAGAGKSELDPALPAEATDPVACGILHKDGTLPLQPLQQQ